MGKRYTLEEMPTTDPGLFDPDDVDHDLRDDPASSTHHPSYPSPAK